MGAARRQGSQGVHIHGAILTASRRQTADELLDHIAGLTVAFAAAAAKDTSDVGGQGPSGDGSRLGADWRARIAQDLGVLTAAWRDPTAWTGMTRAGGIDLPGEIAGLVALDELVIHGWDLARATKQTYDCDRSSLEAVQQFLAGMSEPGQAEQRQQIFGPLVAVADDAPMLDRVIGLSGRNPTWSP